MSILDSNLSGKRILITRSQTQAAGFAAQLRAFGAEPIILPMIAIQALADPRPLDQALMKISRYDWIIFTSANAVEQVCARFDHLGIKPPAPKIKVAAIGQSTAQALKERGISPQLIPPSQHSADLFASLCAMIPLKGLRILLPQSDLAPPTLANLLTQSGALVDSIRAYHNVQPEIDLSGLDQVCDAITFTSSSAAHNFVNLFGLDHPSFQNALVAYIGTSTAATAQGLGLPVHAIAQPQSIAGLIQALSRAFAPQNAPL